MLISRGGGEIGGGGAGILAWGARPVGAGRVDKEANDANTGHPKKVMADGPRCLFYSKAHLTRPMRRQPGFHGGGFGIPIPMATEDNEGTHVSACPRTHLRAQAPPRHTLTHARARARACVCTSNHMQCALSEAGCLRMVIAEATTMEARLSSHAWAGQVRVSPPCAVKEAARPVGHHFFLGTRICIICVF